MKTFDCGVFELNEYLNRYALKNDIDNIGKTYLCITDGKIIGYFTLANASVSHDDIIELSTKLPRYPIPFTRLARLAVDKDYQHRHIGLHLLQHATAISYNNSHTIASYGIVVDAKPQSKEFYLHYGFTPLAKGDVFILPFTELQKMFKSV